MHLKLILANLPKFKHLEKSEAVGQLQAILDELGYDIGRSGVDKIYGKATKKALEKFTETGQIKKNGSIGVHTLAALTAPITFTPPPIINTEGYVPLSWEKKKHPERKKWSAFVFKMVDFYFDDSFTACEDITRFRRDYHSLNRQQKINVWGELISAVCKFESGWDPTSRMTETTMNIDPVTGRQVESEGLMQLSYQDKRNYRRNKRIKCQFDWKKDKPLFEKNPRDPNITILNPYYNLEFGIGILANQIKKRKKIALTKSKYLYWSVLKDGGRYSKVDKIIAYVEKLKL